MTTTPATLMVVDDDPEIRELLADYLGRHGYRVFTAEGAQALYQQLAEQTPDLLIVDVMMPGDDGFTICRELRKHSDLPIIMLTASADDTDRILGLELGADDYLGKPFNPRELVDQAGERTALSGADFQLLQVFLERPAQVITRDDLYALTRGRDAPPLDRSIDVHVCRLRQRLGEDAQHSQLIRTVRGAGYVLTAQVDTTL